MTDLIERAKWFAIGAHGYQQRKYTGEPYWHHLQEVVSILEENGYKDEYMIASAWLHDVVEDTIFSVFDIREFFGSKVAHYVSDLTKPNCGNRKTRNAEYNFKLHCSCSNVQTIKYADLISNTSSIVERDPEFAKVYLAEKMELLERIPDGCPKLYKIACDLTKSD